MDDVIVASDGATMEEAVANHKKDVEAVLAKFRELNLVCELSKAQMFVSRVEFCGHVIGGGVRSPSPGKLSSLAKWPRPSTVTELRAFLGFCNWYQDYVENFARMAGPLQNMLRLKKGEAKAGCKKPLAWSVEANECFNKLKEALLRRLELNLIDPDKPFILETDASGYAVGCVVKQEIAGTPSPWHFGQGN